MEASRRESREDARWRAVTILRERGLASLCDFDNLQLLTHAAEVTPQAAALCFPALRQRGVEFVVAPCEADAQLTQLALSGRVQVVKTGMKIVIPSGVRRPTT